jgi:antitoxin CcdA
MIHAYNYSAPKKPTNLSINSDLLAKAKGLKLNLSATLEIALAEQVQKAERDNWLKQNQAAIEASNEFVEKYGLFSDSYRTL